MSATLAASWVLFLPELRLQSLALPAASLCVLPSYFFFFPSLTMEFVYSDPSVIKDQLVLQHSDEQYLFLQSVWYPQWGKLECQGTRAGTAYISLSISISIQAIALKSLV